MEKSVQNKDIFTSLDAMFIAISLITYLAAICTDVIVAINLLDMGHVSWGIVILTIFGVTSVVMAIVSLCWYFTEAPEEKRCMKCLTHLFCLTPVYRYVDAMTRGIDAQRSCDKRSCEVYFQSVRDAGLVRLIEAFLQSAPQLALQLYVMISLDLYGRIMWLSVSMSAISIGFAMAGHISGKHLVYDRSLEILWPPAVVLLVWHMLMVVSRILAIVVFAHAFAYWIFVALGIHWSAMFVWLCIENKNSPRNPCAARGLDLITSYVHIFCFFNRRSGHTRLRVFIYYLIVLIENALFVGLWSGLKPDGSNPTVIIMVVVFGGFLLGVLLMFLYYGCCHDGGRFIKMTAPFFTRNPRLPSQGNTYRRNPSPSDLSDEDLAKRGGAKRYKREKPAKKNERTKESTSSTASNEYLIKNNTRQPSENDTRNYNYLPDRNKNGRPNQLYTITTSVSTYEQGKSPSASSGKVSISPLDASKLWEASTDRCGETEDKRYYDSTVDEMKGKKEWMDSANIGRSDVKVSAFGSRRHEMPLSLSPTEKKQVGRSARRSCESTATNSYDPDDDKFVDRMEYKRRAMANNESALYEKLDTSKYPTDDPDLEFDGRVGIHDSVISKRNGERCNDSITTPMRQNRGFGSPTRDYIDPTNAMYRKILKGIARPRESIEEYAASPYKPSDRVGGSSNRTLASLAQSYEERGAGISKTTSKEQLDEITRQMSSGNDSDYSDEIMSYLDSEGGCEKDRKTDDKRYYNMGGDSMSRKEPWGGKASLKDGGTARDHVGRENGSGNHRKPWDEVMADMDKNTPSLEHVDAIRHEYVPGNDILGSLISSGDKVGSVGIHRTESVSQPGNEVMKTLISGVDKGVARDPARKVHPLAEKHDDGSLKTKAKPPIDPNSRMRGVSGRAHVKDQDIVDRSSSLRNAAQLQKVYVPGNEILQTFVSEDGTLVSEQEQLGVQNFEPERKGNSVMQELVSSSHPEKPHETTIDARIGDSKENDSGYKKGSRSDRGRQYQRRPFGAVNQPSVRL